MHTKPEITTFGTAKEIAWRGYVASGISEHSRRSASLGNIKLPSYVVNPPKRRGPRSLNELIAENAHALTALKAKLRTETNMTRRARLTKDIGIKRDFLSRLEKERAEL